MARNINAVKAMMVGNARNQFADWIKADAPFRAITLNPKLVREPRVFNVALLEDSTAVVEFTTTTTQSPTDKPVIQKIHCDFPLSDCPSHSRRRARPQSVRALLSVVLHAEDLMMNANRTFAIVDGRRAVRWRDVPAGQCREKGRSAVGRVVRCRERHERSDEPG